LFSAVHARLLQVGGTEKRKSPVQTVRGIFLFVAKHKMAIFDKNNFLSMLYAMFEKSIINQKVICG